MSLIDTISEQSHFWHWLQSGSGSYKDNFSYEGAVALQNYFEELSNDTGTDIEFDPVAWCVEFSEYDSLDDFNTQYWGNDKKNGNRFTLDQLQDETTVIELDNGGIIVGEF